MTDKPDIRQGEQRPFYNDMQLRVLAAHFSEAALPMLEQAGRILQDLHTNPVGKIQQCDRHRCTAVRVRILNPATELPEWQYVSPAYQALDDPEACPIGKDQHHEWRAREGRLY